MKNKVMELLNNQMEARHALAKNIVEQTKELLAELGCENLLTDTAIKEVVVSSEEDKKTIKELTQELKKTSKLLEYNKGVNTTLRNKIKELKDAAPVEIIKEVKVPVEVIKEVPVEVQDTKLIAELNNQLAVKDSIIEALNKKIQALESQTNTSTAKVHIEEKVDIETPETLKIKNNFKTHIIGEYKGVAFEAMKKVVGTTIYDANQWGLKDELNDLLIDLKLIDADRDIKDQFRVECEFGSCHEIDDKKYMGYVVVDDKTYNYVFDTKHRGGYPCCAKLDQYLVNPHAKKFPCKTKSINNAINSLLAMHKANEDKFRMEGAVLLNEIMGNIAPVNNVETPVIDNNTAVGNMFNEDIIPAVDNSVTTTQDKADGMIGFGWEDEESL